MIINSLAAVAAAARQAQTEPFQKKVVSSHLTILRHTHIISSVPTFFMQGE